MNERFASTGKGGIVSLPAFTVPAAAPVGTVDQQTLATNRGRFTGTQFQRVQIVASGDLADPDELRRLTLTILISGRPIPTVQDVPLDTIFRRPLELDQWIPEDAQITAVLAAVDALTTIANNTLTVRLWGEGLTAAGTATQFRDEWRVG